MRSVHKLVNMALSGQEYRDWYRWAKSDIAYACAVMGTCPRKFSDLLAVTSPRVSVSRNIRYAIMLTERPSDKPHDMMRTVWSSVQHYYRTGEIRGPKTGPFARALRGDLSAVPLDVWMARALNVSHKKLATKQIREPAVKRIRAVARILGWKPAEVQAAIWASAVRDIGNGKVRRIPMMDVSGNVNLWNLKIAA